MIYIYTLYLRTYIYIYVVTSYCPCGVSRIGHVFNDKLANICGSRVLNHPWMTVFCKGSMQLGVPIGCIPWTLQKTNIAMEIYMENGEFTSMIYP